MTDEAAPGRPPWHLWVVGGLTLLWNGYGAFDYVMSVTQNAAYMAMFTEEQRAYYAAFPSWATSIWAIAVWGAVTGSILLLLRRRAAVIIFEIALAAFLISLVYMYIMTNGAQVAGLVGMAMSAAILAVAVFEVAYAYVVRRKGTLR